MVQRSASSLLVLPRNRSSEATIHTLSHPRTGERCRYLVDPTNGIFEFTCVSTLDEAPRSWLITRDGTSHATDGTGSGSREEVRSSRRNDNDFQSKSTLISKPRLLVATTVDPLFLLLSAFDRDQKEADTARKLFVSADDIFDQVIEKSPEFEIVTKHGSLRTKLETSLKAICDVVEAGDDSMYRLSETKLLNELVKKARIVARHKLPESLEGRFVQRALDMPLTKNFGDDLEAEVPSSQPEVSQTESASSEDSTEGVSSLHSEASVATNVTTPSDGDVSPGLDLSGLLRVRKVLNFIIGSYVPASMTASLGAILASPKSPMDFAPLDQRLEEVARIRAETLAARSVGDFSRKRNAYEEDDAAEVRAEKRRKKEEEEKRKKLESRATRDLKKVDTTGMKKMSQFFARRSPRKK